MNYQVPGITRGNIENPFWLQWKLFDECLELLLPMTRSWLADALSMPSRATTVTNFRDCYRWLHYEALLEATVEALRRSNPDVR